MDHHLLSDGDLQWQAQLLANYSGHIFVSRALDNNPAHLVQTVIESSLVILALRAEVSDLKSQNSTLASESKQLEEEMEQMEDKHRDQLQKLAQTSRNRQSSSYRSASGSPPISNESEGSRVALHHPGWSATNSHHVDRGYWASMSLPSFNVHQRQLLKQEGDDLTPAEQLQLDWLDSDRHNTEVAARKQWQFDEEDRYLRAQMEGLTRDTQSQFQCGVCLDEQPEDVIARLEPCGHCFCRDCIRGYVGSKLAENRYPIVCPVCMTEGGKDDPGGALSCSVFE